MKAIVAARSHAEPSGYCNVCDKGDSRRTALLYLLSDAIVADRELHICASCVRSLLYAARTTVKRRAR